jgi:selenocysteine lyase/cysteine desulfurase
MKQDIIEPKREKNSNILLHEDFFNRIRHLEYPLLDTMGHTYLDYTGGNLYAKSHLEKHHDLLNNNILGNPHSSNPTSVMSSKLVAEARQKVLEYFNAKDYFCIFTQNASNALKIVGECYPFSAKSKLVLLADNHNSVNGIREYCADKGGTFEYCPIQYEDLRIDPTELNKLLVAPADCTHKLFAFPAQSNVSGVKHNLAWVAKAQALDWDVLLDAAAFVPSSRLDLDKVRPDFVTISFYKIFGYPTGIGCLLVKKTKFAKLRKPWFAGGTVTLASVKTRHHYLAENHERFEDGTINYLEIPAIQSGLEFIESIGIDRITERVISLIDYLYDELVKITHHTGVSVVHIFGPEDRKNVGGTLIMNFVDDQGEVYPFEFIEEITNSKLISIRSGCFCNPGTDEINSCLTIEELSQYFTSRDSGNYHDMIKNLGKMRGAIRVSVGIATTKKDLDVFISFVHELMNKSKKD